MIGTDWREVKAGQSVGMMQGYALNTLVSKYHPCKVEMGWLDDTQAYKLTLKDGKQAVYADYGDVLELITTEEV